MRPIRALESGSQRALGPTAPVSEVFSSSQGEGLLLGVRQIFVRFAQCNLSCDYCDEVSSGHRWPKTQSFDAKRLLRKICRLEAARGPHHSVSLTGGEPLLHRDFLEDFLPMLKRAGFKVYLESNGTLPSVMERLVCYCDYLAMDVKLASSSGHRGWLKTHRLFLRTALPIRQVFVKAVLCASTPFREVLACARMIRGVDAAVPLVLQPQSSGAGPEPRAWKKALDDFYPRLTGELRQVRVLAQMHKIWGIR
ncbi:MAG: 7-carboxy-7-deazaguanine synthase QueE [Candidatus Omnitrophota bacterium]